MAALVTPDAWTWNRPGPTGIPRCVNKHTGRYSACSARSIRKPHARLHVAITSTSETGKPEVREVDWSAVGGRPPPPESAAPKPVTLSSGQGPCAQHGS